MNTQNSTASTMDAAIDLYRSLVMLDDGEGRTTSNKIAARFGRTHTSVLRSIDRIIAAMKSQEFCFRGEIFREHYVMDQRGRTRRQFSVSKDGFILLAMRFDGAAALGWQLKFIAAFNWLTGQLAMRAENNRMMATFEIKERKSIQDGTTHGIGLQLRKTEKRDLAAEESDIRANVQCTLMLDTSGREH